LLPALRTDVHAKEAASEALQTGLSDGGAQAAAERPTLRGMVEGELFRVPFE
jgi:hypothetical protein